MKQTGVSHVFRESEGRGPERFPGGFPGCDLLGQLSEIPGLDISQHDSKSLCTLLLYGSPSLNIIANRMIMEATISFIKETKRLD